MAIIDRTGASALIPETTASQIIQEVPEASAVLSLFKRLPNMTASQHHLPVLSVLPMAYFVDGEPQTGHSEYGRKKTTEVNWDRVTLTAEEIAVIVPIPEAVLADANYDIWGEARPRLVEAIGKKIDEAILFGVDKPSSWPLGLVPAAKAKGNVVVLGTGNDLYDDIMGEGGVLSLVEEDGFLVNGHIAAMSMKAKLRGLRSSQDKLPIFVREMQSKTGYTLDGEPLYFPKNGAFDPTEALLITGDFNNAVYSIRQDVTYKLLTEATIYDPSNAAVVYMLAQQDMVALRVVIRLGWAVPNPVTGLNTNSNYRYPFAVLASSDSSSS